MREYSNGEITVVWKPECCTHVGFCFRGLPEVFQPMERPWVHIEGATTDELVSQVEACPSGALTFYYNE